MQSSSRSRVFNPTLAGASPATDANLWLNANCPRSSDRLERRSAKAEVAGAIPAVDAISQDCGVTSSISPCEGDGPGANPGFLTITAGLRAQAAALVHRLPVCLFRGPRFATAYLDGTCAPHPPHHPSEASPEPLHMPSICPPYALHMPSICPPYALHMPSRCTP